MDEAEPSALGNAEALEEIYALCAKQYLEERARLAEEAFKASHHADLWSMSIAGGAFGVSFAFLKDVLSGGRPAAGFLLGVAWLCFAVSIACTLASLHAGRHSHYAHIDKLDSEAAGTFQGTLDKVPGFLNRVRRHQAEIKSTKWVDRLTYAGGGACVAGLLLLALFAICNSPRSIS